MAITNYGELKTAVANWLNRSDLTSRIPEFVALCESYIAYGLDLGTLGKVDPLRVRALEASADVSLVAGTRTAALPTRYLAMRRLYLNTSPITSLNVLSPTDFWSRYLSTDTGKPRAFTVEGDNLTFGPIPDAAYTGKALFYQKPAAMSGDTDAPTLLTNAPNIYLFGSLVAATSYLKGHSMEQSWFLQFAGAVRSYQSQDKADRYSGAPLQTRTDVGNP